jgi:hypothetical protein
MKRSDLGRYCTVRSIATIKNNASKKELTNFYLFACYLKNFVYICAQIKARKSETFLIHAETDAGNYGVVY